MRQVWTWTAVVVAVCALGACGKAAQPEPEDPTLAPRKSRLSECRWVPVTPEWNEPCTHQNQGAKLEVTLREGGRPEDATKQTATCECE